MRWINSATFFISGLFFIYVGAQGLIDAKRFAGVALVLGVANTIGAIIVAGKGEVRPYKLLPRIATNWWAAVFWYSVIMLLVVKHTAIFGEKPTTGAPRDPTVAILSVFISHVILLGVSPLCYWWSQGYPGQKR